MNALIFLVSIGLLCSLGLVAAIPDEVWSAIADRIRNPRPTLAEQWLAKSIDDDPDAGIPTRDEWRGLGN